MTERPKRGYSNQKKMAEKKRAGRRFKEQNGVNAYSEFDHRTETDEFVNDECSNRSLPEF